MPAGLALGVEGQAVEGSPLAGGGQGGIDDECLAVQMRLGRARDLVPDDRRQQASAQVEILFPGSTEAGDGGVVLQPIQRFPDGGIVWRQQPLVAADRGGEADTLRGEKARSQPGWWERSPPRAPAEPRLGVDPAVQQVLQPLAVGRPVQALCGSAGTEPGRERAGFATIAIGRGEAVGRPLGRPG